MALKKAVESIEYDFSSIYENNDNDKAIKNIKKQYKELCSSLDVAEKQLPLWRYYNLWIYINIVFNI